MLLSYTPQILAMAALAAVSALFSCSEAALFFLSREQREKMASGGPGEKLAVRLLAQPEQLLSAILLCNLITNILYYSLAAGVTIGLQQQKAPTLATGYSIGALLFLMIFSEMLPKNLGVTWPRQIAGLVSVPIALATRAIGPLMPTLRGAMEITRRLLFPRFEAEPYLELEDLDKAVEISSADEELVGNERLVLQQVVALASTTVEEVMRPRRRYLAFHPPVRLSDLKGRPTPSGYVLITEADSDEIAAALPLDELVQASSGRLDHYAEKVEYVPWCASAAEALHNLQRSGRRVAAVLNELGETVGVVTIEDLLAAVLHHATPEEAQRRPIAGILTVDDGVWETAGRTPLRRLAKQIERELPETRGVTVAGMLQEELQRVPERGDMVRWGGFDWQVIAATEQGSLFVRVTELSEGADGLVSADNSQ